MSNINQINGRSRKGHFWHCPKYLKKRCLQHYLGCNFQLKGNTEVHPPDVSAASQGGMTSFSWTHWLPLEVSKCHRTESLSPRRKGYSSCGTFPFWDKPTWPAPKYRGRKCKEQKYHWLGEFAKHCLESIFRRNCVRFSQFFLLIYFSYTFQTRNISFLRKNTLQPKELTFMCFQTFSLVPDKWGTKALPYSAWGSIGWGILGHPTCLASRIMMNCLQLQPQIVF